jgi:hypothetical protein
MADNYITNINSNTISALTQDIDVNGKKIQGAEVDIRTNASNGDVIITANGSGNVKINGLNFPKVDGNANEMLITDGAGNLRFVRPPVGGGSGGGYYWQIAADDSTAIPVETDNIVKFIGGNGITTASDVEGNITITQASQNFSITGEATASAISYDGTGAVALNVTLSDSALDDQYLRLDGTTQPTGAINFNGQNITNAGSITATTFNGAFAGNITGNTTGYHTGDVKGSVFAFDSSLLVDGVGAKIVGDVVNNSVTTDLVNSQVAQIEVSLSVGPVGSPIATIDSFGVGADTFFGPIGAPALTITSPTNMNIQSAAPMAIEGGGGLKLEGSPVAPGYAYSDLDIFGGPVTINGPALLINSEEITIGANGTTSFQSIVDFTNASVKNLNVFNIGADDSTMRAVDVSTNIKFIGGTNITTASDADGNITITNSFTQDFAFGSLTGTPTTLSGYGITDALALAGGTMSGAIDLGTNNISNGGTITATSFVGPVTGNTSGYHTGDVTGSVFADDSSVMVNALDNILQGQVKLTGMTTGTGVGADTGSGDFLPTRPVGYITISINGTNYKVPYYEA